MDIKTVFHEVVRSLSLPLSSNIDGTYYVLHEFSHGIAHDLRSISTWELRL